MRCDKCRNEAVFFQSYSGRHLCGRHLALDIEARAKRTIRSHRWMMPKDHIAVMLSGDKKSAALLFFLKKLLAGRRDIRLSAVPASEGETYRSDLSAIRRIAELLRIPLNEITASGDHGTAAHDRPTKIALALTLDDIAREVLVRFLFGNTETLVHPPQAETDGVPVICPFIAVPAEELEFYWDSQETGFNPVSCPPRQDPLKREMETLFRDFQCRHPATRFALMNLAEELSGGGVEGITAAAPGLNGPGPEGTSGGVPDDDT
jgi:tRNA(Ile)-lysidine synthase TilS/MesJ